MENLQRAKSRHGSEPGTNRGGGRKPSIDLLRDKVRKEITAQFWVELAEKHAEPFIKTVFGDDSVPWDVRLRTWQEVLNRAYGKPKERVENRQVDKDGNDLFNKEDYELRLVNLRNAKK